MSDSKPVGINLSSSSSLHILACVVLSFGNLHLPQACPIMQHGNARNLHITYGTQPRPTTSNGKKTATCPCDWVTVECSATHVHVLVWRNARCSLGKSIDDYVPLSAQALWLQACTHAGANALMSIRAQRCTIYSSCLYRYIFRPNHSIIAGAVPTCAVAQKSLA